HAGVPPMAASGQLDPQEVAALLPTTGPKTAGKTAAPPASDAPSAPHEASAGIAPGNLAAGDIEYLIRQAEEALASVTDPASEPPPAARPFSLRDLPPRRA